MPLTPDQVRAVMNDLVCEDCGHRIANHDGGWCYVCLKVQRQCHYDPDEIAKQVDRLKPETT